MSKPVKIDIEKALAKAKKERSNIQTGKTSPYKASYIDKITLKHAKEENIFVVRFSPDDKFLAVATEFG